MQVHQCRQGACPSRIATATGAMPAGQAVIRVIGKQFVEVHYWARCTRGGPEARVSAGKRGTEIVAVEDGASRQSCRPQSGPRIRHCTLGTMNEDRYRVRMDDSPPTASSRDVCREGYARNGFSF